MFFMYEVLLGDYEEVFYIFYKVVLMVGGF